MIVALAVTAAALAATPPGPSRLLVDPGSVDPYFQKGPFRAPAERFRDGEWKAAAEGLAVALRARNAPKAEIHRARFLLGLAQTSLGNCVEAAATFERLWREESLLRPYYAYQAAGCHLRRGEHERALVWAARVLPGSIPEAETALIRLEALSATRRWREVERAGKRYAEKFPNGPRGSEAAFSTAVAIEAQGRRAEAAELFRRIWAESRSDTLSQRALARLEKAGQAPVGKRAQEWLARGMVLFDRHQNEASEAAFAAALGDADQRLDPAGECLARFHQAQSVWKQRNRTRAAPLFAAAEQACQRAGDSDTRARSLYQGGRCLAMTGNREAARAAFARVEADHPEHRLADDARLRAAESAWEAGDDATAVELARTLPERYPDGDMVGEALWRLAYRSYRAEDFDQARHLLAENRRLVPRASIWYAEGRAEYWEGRILEKQKKPGEAIGWYQLAVRRYPLAVYALLAFGRLEQIAPDTATGLRKELQPRSAGRPRTVRGKGLTGSAGEGLRRAVEFARMGLGSRSYRELARLYNDEQLAATSLLRDVTVTGALVLERAGLWNASHALVDDRLEQFRLFYPTEEAANPWVLAYPRAFRELVETHSRANNVSPELQLALMREESAFNPRAESTANCLGLTMLKPSTAKGLLAKDVTREQLLDPAMNVAVGSRHLAALLKRFRAVVPVIAAYNAGEGPVARWLRDRGHLPVDEFLEEIPYEETRGYTQRVLASFFAYSWLYGRRDRVPDVSLR